MLKVGRRSWPAARAPPAASPPTPPTGTTCPTPSRRVRRSVLRLLRAQPARPAPGAGGAAPGGAAGRDHRHPRVLPAGQPAALEPAVLRSLLQRPGAAAARLGGHRRQGRLPVPARFHRRLPVADGVRGGAASWPGFAPGAAARTCFRGRWPRWWWGDEAGGGRRRRLGLDLCPPPAGHPGRRRPAACPTCRWGWCSRSSGAEVWQHELGNGPRYPFRRYAAQRLPGAVRLRFGGLAGDGGDPLQHRRAWRASPTACPTI